MAKRTDGAEAEWRLLLAAAVVEYGERRLRPYTMKIPSRALRAAEPAGTLKMLNLPRGEVLLTCVIALSIVIELVISKYR